MQKRKSLVAITKFNNEEGGTITISNASPRDHIVTGNNFESAAGMGH
jgi:hypothetical protein